MPNIILWVLLFELSFGDENPEKIEEILVDGERFVFYSDSQHHPVRQLRGELIHDTYDISKIKFNDGDVVLDIGGNIGLFSILLARKHSFLKILAFEPVKQSFENFKTNIRLNNISTGTITLLQKALTGDGRNVTMVHGIQSIMDGMAETRSQYFLKDQVESETSESTTLTQIFEEYQIKKCKLLKMDCEGCEYESLYGTKDVILKKIEVFRGEFHQRPGLVEKNWTPFKLKDDFTNKFPDFKVSLADIQRKNRKKKGLKR